MVVRDFRIGNTIFSDYVFGLNTQQFELLEGVNEGSKLTFSINQYPRNLIKAKIQAPDIVDDTTDPANPATLNKFPFDLTFVNVLEGAEGVLLIENNSTTKLKFEPTIPISKNSNIYVRETGITALRFIYEGGLFHFQSDYKPLSANISEVIELEIDNSQPPIQGKRFNNIKDCVKWILLEASVQVHDELFSKDDGGQSVIVRIYYGLGEYKEAFYIPRTNDIGIKFVGISNESGQKPIINSTKITNQFGRTFNASSSRNLVCENLHFVKNDQSSTLILANRNSNVTFIECTFENGSLSDSKNFIQAAMNSSINIVGEFNLISASGQEGILFISQNNSKIKFKNIIFTSTGNANGGMAISVNQPITFSSIFEAEWYSTIVVNDYIDGSDDGILRYKPGDILYQQLYNVQSGAEVTNYSSNFPG